MVFLPEKRRLRHINYIYGRNLIETDSNSLMDVYLTLHEKGSEWLVLLS